MGLMSQQHLRHLSTCPAEVMEPEWLPEHFYKTVLHENSQFPIIFYYTIAAAFKWLTFSLGYCQWHRLYISTL